MIGHHPTVFPSAFCPRVLSLSSYAATALNGHPFSGMADFKQSTRVITLANVDTHTHGYLMTGIKSGTACRTVSFHYRSLTSLCLLVSQVGLMVCMVSALLPLMCQKGIGKRGLSLDTNSLNGCSSPCAPSGCPQWYTSLMPPVAAPSGTCLLFCKRHSFFS